MKVKQEGGKKEKVMTDKYFEAVEVSEKVKEILTKYADVFTHFTHNEMVFLFKTGKNNPEKKHVSVKIVKEPITLLTNKKILFIVNEQWWKDEGFEERSKELIEGLVSIDIGKGGVLKKRNFDIQTFSDFVKGGKLDFSRFSKILPADKKNDLVLN